MPSTVEVGGGAELDCEWEQGDTMYSIKWYQGSTEFYRFTPSALRQVQIFEPNTLDVDVSIMACFGCVWVGMGVFVWDVFRCV